MTKKPGDLPRNQHYVPQFLLRRFSVVAGEEQVWAYDKKTGKTFRTNVRNVASQRDYYNIPKVEDASLEPALGAMEANAAEVVERLLASESLSSLTSDDRSALALFAAAQMNRTTHFEEVIKFMTEGLRDHLRKMGSEEELVLSSTRLSDEERKVLHLRHILEADKYAALLAGMDWCLMRTKPVNPFWISDNPLLRHNSEDFGPYGNLGLALPGMEVYLPLSPTITLAMFDQLHVKRARTAARNATLAVLVDPPSPEILATAERLEQWAHRIERGDVLEATGDNVIFHNCLQVRWSERLLFSPIKNFDMAERYLREYPIFRGSGMRPKMD